MSADKLPQRVLPPIACSTFDPVHNVMLAPEVGELPYAVETRLDARWMNLRLAKSFGITSFLEERRTAA